MLNILGFSTPDFVYLHGDQLDVLSDITFEFIQDSKIPIERKKDMESSENKAESFLFTWTQDEEDIKV